jgi:tetratricopeptide (TPR) repeat protein
MRPHYAFLAIILAASSLPLIAQTETSATAPAATPEASAPAASPAVAPGQETSAAPAPRAAAPVAPAATSAQASPAAPAAAKVDALLLYKQGRDLEAAGKQADAQAKYNQAIAICDKEMASDPRRIEAYVVKCWSLFRLNRHAEVVSTGQAAMKINFDARVSEVMGESYYFLGQIDASLKALQKYLEVAGDTGDRGPTALFFMGECYLKQKKYSHADIAYSSALAKEPSMSRWWFRLGNACEALGEWKRASDSYGKALALTPSFQDAKAGQDRAKAKLTTP